MVEVIYYEYLRIIKEIEKHAERGKISLVEKISVIGSIVLYFFGIVFVIIPGREILGGSLCLLGMLLFYPSIVSTKKKSISDSGIKKRIKNEFEKKEKLVDCLLTKYGFDYKDTRKLNQLIDLLKEQRNKKNSGRKAVSINRLMTGTFIPIISNWYSPFAEKSTVDVVSEILNILIIPIILYMLVLWFVYSLMDRGVIKTVHNYDSLILDLQELITFDVSSPDCDVDNE